MVRREDLASEFLKLFVLIWTEVVDREKMQGNQENLPQFPYPLVLNTFPLGWEDCRS